MGFLAQYGVQVLLIGLLMALLGLRARVNAHTSLFIKAGPERLWDILNPVDGRTDNWGRVTVVAQRLDAPGEIYEMTYRSAGPGGVERIFKAQFGVAARENLRRIVLRREGLDGRSLNNELLEIHHEISPAEGGCRVATRYLWGPRQLLAQLLARTDLWSGSYRLKSLAETGVASNTGYFWINLAMALITGGLSLCAFGLMFNFGFSLVVLVVLAVHEFGHLLAFRLVGQPWGRLVFLPFLGAAAVPRLPFENQAQSVFAALMGPGLSLVFALACSIAYSFGWRHGDMWAALGAVTAALNLFNMLPAEPLDGGVALRSVLSRIMGAKARLGLMALGALIVLAGYFSSQIALMIFGAMAIAANLRLRKIDTGLAPLSMLQLSLAIFGYVVITAAHFTLLFRFIEQIGV